MRGPRFELAIQLRNRLLCAARRGLAVVCCVAPAHAATIVVAPDGSGDRPTIQAAIDVAAPGDVIELQDGVFTGAGNRDMDFHGRVTCKIQGSN